MGQRIKPKPKQTSILSYWTLRYFAILCLGLAIITVAAVYWIRETARDSRLKTTGLLGQEISERVTSPNGEIVIPPDFEHLLKSRFVYFNLDKDELCLIITDDQGKLVFSKPKISNTDLKHKLTDDLAESRDNRFMAVTTPIMSGGEKKGQVALLQSKRSLTYSPNEIILVVLLLLTLVLCGWITLYALSRKLSRPIRRVALGARQIAAGSYDVNLDIATPEREIQELIGSFKDMAVRLKQLEAWRALQLAGVTHELKTPVTSIKGLLLAVREGVVNREEAEEFLDIALKESERLEWMVADLLNYNALSSGSLEVKNSPLHVKLLIEEIVYQWGLLHEEDQASVTIEPGGEELVALGDALRIQQIVVNLLNNALQAADERPLRVDIRLIPHDRYLDILVRDNGGGIAAEEQPYIFEQFYRGQAKKRKVRGLGLGLTYSRLLARAQGGDLLLDSSTDAGSAFMLKLRREQADWEQKPERKHSLERAAADTGR
ncbi:HAMP domain-containing sensor histidine kinase [Paenibacillus macerans]|uniref:HAMP domain-containing sensor histidine kinase n=1 Tax=Paenibacillus macerans TaxID=44252 RepID=UPI00203A9D63|nr:HAMP domain-containing sensor histidine kinase [Paenibacillus macerans]MCM3703237.1 HAMP domain-containing histidine kinase [Paenibacillus macerans]